MILELAFAPIFVFARFLISIIPNTNVSSGGIGGVFYELMSYGLYFFGVAPFVLVITTVLFWIAVDIGWICIEWVYVKVPGVN